MNEFTMGIWKDERFQTVAKLQDSRLENPAMIIHPPQSEQQVRDALKVLENRGLLKFENGHYTVTPVGERLHRTVEQTLLQAFQVEENKHDA
jgi:predicted transcriptional regulator